MMRPTLSILPWGIIAILSPIPALLSYFSGSWYTIFEPWSIARVLGICGYIYLLNQFITGSRLRFFERRYGMDRVIRFHRMMGSIGLLLIFAHRTIRVRMGAGEGLQTRLGSIAALLFVVVVLSAFLLLTRQPLGRFGAVLRLRRWASQRLGLRYWHIRLFHNLTAVAISLALLHVLLASSTAQRPTNTIIMAGWYLMAMGCYINHKLIRQIRLRRTPFVVSRVTPMADTIISVELRAPHGSCFDFQPGQFAYFRFLDGAPTREEHPLTISSAPNGGSITFTAKQVGNWSRELGQIAPGARVTVEGPYGRFSHVWLPDEAPLCLIAGGIGITPLFGMIEHIAANDEKTRRRIRLLWGVRRRSEAIRLDWLRGLEQTLPDFRVVLAISSEAGERGLPQRITPAAIGEAVPNEKWRDTHFFVCGPFEMQQSIITGLLAGGAVRTGVHSEQFNL